MKYRYHLLFLGLLSTTFLLGQVTPLTQANGQTVGIFDRAEKSIKGSPYWRDSWVEGQIVWLNGSSTKGIPIKILTHKQTELCTKQPNGDSVVVAITKLKAIYLIDPETKDSVVFKKIRHTENVTGELMRVIYDGNFAIVARHINTLQNNSSASNSDAGYEFEEYVKKVEYALYQPKQALLTKIKLGKKAILKILPGKDQALETYIEANKLNLDKEKDIARLAAYYDSLQKP
jgi:hypothetical protein